MTSKPEREVDARLADWVDGRLGERERERFVAELRVSPQLRKDLEDYEKTVAAVRAALQAPARPVQIADRVMAAIAAGNTRSSVGPRWRNRSFLWSLASAAALLVLALLVNTWSPAPKTDATASVDAMKAEGEKRREGDDVRKKTGEAGAVRQDGWLDREKSEKVAVEEQARTAAPAAPATQPAPTPPAPAAAREPAPAEGNEAPLERAVAQEKPAVPAAKAQRANDPAAPRGDAGGKQAGGGGAQPGGSAPVEHDLVTAGAWGEQLPFIVVQGSALVADSRNTESRLQDGQSVPTGSSTGKAGRQVPPAQPGADAPPSAAPSPGPAMRRAAEIAEVPPQLEAFFKRQMTVASPSDTGGAAWSTGGLQFTPLPNAEALAADNERKETEAKAAGEQAKDRSRSGAAGRDGVAPVERGWLVEGSEEDLKLVIRQLSLFARGSDMHLTTGWTSEAAPPKQGAPEGAVRQSDDKDKPKDNAGEKRPELPRSRLVLRFSAQPR
jgi:hypothetical protein